MSGGGGGGSSYSTVAYRYYMGLHMLLGARVDALLKVRVQKRTLWSGEQSSGSISIDKSQIFGGNTREGGFVGVGDLLMGGDSQGVNSYLSSKLGSANVPTYRGLMSIVWRRPWLQSNNSYMFPHEYQVKRTQTLTDGSAQPYLSKAEISSATGGLNPAHVIREALTNPIWGMGYPVSSIDNSAFQDMADTLYSEDFGFNFFWDKPEEEIQTFIQMIMDHINGTVYVDPATGLFVMKLIRNDYVAESLLVLDESNIKELSYERIGWGETVNQITVRYTNKNTGEDKITAPVQDIGNIQLQGDIVTEEHHYPGIMDGSLAAKLAIRDLKVTSSPLAKLTIKADRTAYNLLPGSVFKLTWVKYGIAELICRVGSVDFGTLQDGTITIEALEDVFGMPYSSFVEAPVSGFVDPTSDPAPCPQELAYEASYWEVRMMLIDQGLSEPIYGTDFGMLAACGTAPSGDTYGMEFHTRVGATDFEERGQATPCPYAELDGAIGQEDDGVYSVKNHALLTEILTEGTDSFAYLGEEMVAITDTDYIAETITMTRGVCDTTPEVHADGTPIFFPNHDVVVDSSEYIAPETVDSKLLPITSKGILDLGAAATMQVTMNTRYQRPYPPGKVRINTLSYPTIVENDLTFAWAHRDRTLQEAYFNPQTEGNIGPEAGTTYTLRIYESTVLRRTYTGLTGTSLLYDVPTLLADFVGAGPSFDVRIQLEAVRDGYTSWKYQQRDFTLDVSTYVNIASETDSALEIIHSKAGQLDQATETDQALGITQSKTEGVDQATETDNAFTVTVA